jgi:hypothetical protein
MRAWTMSSETSTDALQPWQLFTLAGLVGATIVVFMSRGQTPAAVILLSLTIFTAAGVGAAAWRTLAPVADADDPTLVKVVGGRTRAALEREKALVLRSIKELEFDRAMGKVSDKDFDEMSTRLRTRAARLIRQLDAGTGYREQIEKELQHRLPKRAPESREQRPRSQDASAVRLDLGDDGQFTSPSAARICASCGTASDADARFCKACGTGLGPRA